MNEPTIATSIIVAAIILAAVTVIGLISRSSLEKLYDKKLNEAIFDWKDEPESTVLEVYTWARIREDELEENYDASERDDVEVAALIDGLEKIALSKGYVLPTDDEIFNEG